MGRKKKNIYHISFQPQKLTLEARENETLLRVAERSGIRIEGLCGGVGTCGKCKIQISPPPRPDVIEEEILTEGEIEEGIRLACRSKIEADLQVTLVKIYPESLKILENGLAGLYPFDPPILSFVRNKAKVFGAAIDIGTTTLVASLIDLSSGQEIARTSSANPQLVHGEDIFTRAHYALRDKGGLSQLFQEIIAAVNGLLEDLIQQAKIDVVNLQEISVAGNTCMFHFFTKTDTSSLVIAPYKPSFTRSRVLKAQDLGINTAPEAWVYLLPSASAFIGADIVAGLVAVNLRNRPKPFLFIDMGTNGEIVLAGEDDISACSTAAGPALEGMNITCGMRAESGAIEEIHLDNELLLFTVIGGGSPRGFCGSGLIDIVAELLKVGILDTTGRLRRGSRLIFKNSLYKGQTRKYGEIFAFEISKRKKGRGKIYLTQKDIRQFQLAKGAISAGVKILLKEKGLREEDLFEILIAGAFGHQLRLESFARLGFVSPSSIGKIKFVDNTAKSGAHLALISKEARQEAERVASLIKTVDLSLHPEFESEFIRAMSFL